MSTSKHIYNDGDEYQRVVILNHGGSETTVLYDSDERETPPLFNRRQKNSWHRKRQEEKEKEKEKESWLSEALKRAGGSLL